MVLPFQLCLLVLMRSIEEQNGYPPVIPVIGLGTNELKVTKTGFMKALLYIMKSRWTIKCRKQRIFFFNRYCRRESKLPEMAVVLSISSL